MPLRDCNCNNIPSGAFVRATLRHFSEAAEDFSAVAKEDDLLSAVGRVYRCARDLESPHPSPNSCTGCFEGIAKDLQDRGLFQGETLPKRTHGEDCERRKQAGNIPTCRGTCG